MLAQLVPELALARVVSGGGPYRPGDEISLAFMTPTVSRIVAHDAELRAKCVPLENAVIPEMISVQITHAAAPYEPGDVLMLSFVDPRVARVYISAGLARAATDAEPPNSQQRRRNDASRTPGHAGRGFTEPAEDVRSASEALERADIDPQNSRTLSTASVPSVPFVRDDASGAAETTGQDLSLASREHPRAPATASDTETLLERDDVPTTAPTNVDDSFASDETRTSAGTGDDRVSSVPESTRTQEAASAGDTSLILQNTRTVETANASGSDSALAADDGAAVAKPIRAGDRMTLQADAAHGIQEPQATAGARGATILIRLEWNQERLRRFVQVVDKLFTIDRLGWYRHSLAMRLLIPDEITSDDTLANVEAMRHLQALRSAAVESLGKPLLAACMPGFSITSEWLESLESPREARAIAGLRDALLPYASDAESSEAPPPDASFTLGSLNRRELIAENAVSVEAFLPLLIATKAHDPALTVRLAEYRRLLVELFAQTARAGEPVRLHQMAQPNHSLDDRLWQLVGAAGEAFGGFAHA